MSSKSWIAGWRPLKGRLELRMTVWSQVEVCGRMLSLRPIGCTPALTVTQKRRCSCGLWRSIYVICLCLCLSPYILMILPTPQAAWVFQQRSKWNLFNIFLFCRLFRVLLLVRTFFVRTLFFRRRRRRFFLLRLFLLRHFCVLLQTVHRHELHVNTWSLSDFIHFSQSC